MVSVVKTFLSSSFFILLNIKERDFPYVPTVIFIIKWLSAYALIRLEQLSVLWYAWCFKTLLQKRTASLVSPLAWDFCLIKKAFPPANFACYNLFVLFQTVPCLAQVVQSRSVCYLSKSPRTLLFRSCKSTVSHITLDQTAENVERKGFEFVSLWDTPSSFTC